MSSAAVLLLALLLACSHAKPTTESTHDLLQRLGFDPVGKPVNHHRKRVALEASKARQNDVYSSDTDSHMFVVKLPPHQPYYSHSKPEKFSNEVVTKPPMSLRTNGQPGRVYHWNMPLHSKLAPHKKYPKKDYGDSKIFHLKILTEKHAGGKRHPEKPLKHHKDNVKFYKPHDGNRTKEHVLSIKELAAESSHKHLYDMSQNDRPMPARPHKTKMYARKNTGENEVFHISQDGGKYQGKAGGPSYYSPAIPKQNSFFKYFPGNGKPKSFYVIEKSDKPGRFHRLI